MEIFILTNIDYIFTKNLIFKIKQASKIKYFFIIIFTLFYFVNCSSVFSQENSIQRKIEFIEELIKNPQDIKQLIIKYDFYYDKYWGDSTYAIRRFLASEAQFLNKYQNHSAFVYSRNEDGDIINLRYLGDKLAKDYMNNIEFRFDYLGKWILHSIVIEYPIMILSDSIELYKYQNNIERKIPNTQCVNTICNSQNFLANKFDFVNQIFLHQMNVEEFNEISNKNGIHFINDSISLSVNNIIKNFMKNKNKIYFDLYYPIGIDDSEIIHDNLNFTNDCIIINNYDTKENKAKYLTFYFTTKENKCYLSKILKGTQVYQAFDKFEQVMKPMKE